MTIKYSKLENFFKNNIKPHTKIYVSIMSPFGTDNFVLEITFKNNIAFTDFDTDEHTKMSTIKEVTEEIIKKKANKMYLRGNYKDKEIDLIS